MLAQFAYSGSRIIKDRIIEHRTNTEILRYHNLKVFWAEVDQSYIYGVERYLADKLKPLVGDRHPEAVPIEVNWPWN